MSPFHRWVRTTVEKVTLGGLLWGSCLNTEILQRKNSDAAGRYKTHKQEDWTECVGFQDVFASERGNGVKSWIVKNHLLRKTSNGMGNRVSYVTVFKTTFRASTMRLVDRPLHPQPPLSC